MSAFAAHRLQEAVYAALAADAAISSRITAIYDRPPEGAVTPYLSFGEATVEPYDTKTTRGCTVQFDIVVWEAEGGQMEAKEIMALVDAALHDNALMVADYDLISLRLVRARASRDDSEASSLTEGRLSYEALLFAA